MPRKCRRTAAVLPNIQSNCGGITMIIQIIELLATGTAIVIGITLVVLGIAIWWASRR